MSAPVPPAQSDAPPPHGAPDVDVSASLRGTKALAWVALVIGIVSILSSLNVFLRDPVELVVHTLLGGIALTSAIVAMVRFRRAGRPAPPVGVAGLVLAIVSLAIVALGALQFVFFFVFAERLEEAPAPVSSSEAAQQQAATEEEFADVAQTAAEALEAVRLADGAFPEVLAVTTDQRDLITPDGVEIAELPSDTSVVYEVYTDATQYQLLLFGPHGTRARVDSEGDLDVEHVPYANW